MFDQHIQLFELIRLKKLQYPEISLKLDEVFTQITEEQWNDPNNKIVMKIMKEKELRFDQIYIDFD